MFDSLFGDLADFQKYGALFLQGVYFPRYPLPAMGFFVALSLIPLPGAIALIAALSIIALVHLFRRGALYWILYAPILQCLAFGNVDVLCLWLLRHASPVSLALLTLKPQLFLFALPTLIKRREIWRPFAAWCTLLWGVPTLLYPQWPGVWLRGSNDGRIEQGTSASLWPVPLLALAIIVTMLILRRFDWRVVVSALNPLLRAYDYTMIAGASAWLVPLSWLCVALMWQAGAAWPMALLALPLLIHGPAQVVFPIHRLRRYRRRSADLPAR